jgi:predicted porin
MDNITNFGTGQYYVDLPFAAKYGYQVREGCLHDISTDRQYAIGGHVLAGQSRLNLFYTDTNGQDQEFDYNSPITLNAADNFHVSGTYITAS